MEQRDLMQFIFVAFCTFLLLLLLTFHCIRSCKAFHSSNYDLRFEFNSVLSYSFILIFIGLIYCSVALWKELTLLIDGSLHYHFCSLTLTLFVIIYGLFKLAMYYTLFTRLSQSYKGASNLYTCSNRFYVICKILLIVVIPPYLYICNKYIQVDANKIEKGKCKADIPMFISISALGSDVILGVITLYLFIHPLMKLQRGMDDHNNSSKPDLHRMKSHSYVTFQKLIKKNAILATLTILSSVATWIMIALFPWIKEMPVLCQVTDQTISCFCIILLFKWNEVPLICCKENNEIKKQRESTLNMIHRSSSMRVSEKQNTKPKIILTPTISTTMNTAESQTEIENEPNSKTETEVP